MAKYAAPMIPPPSKDAPDALLTVNEAAAVLSIPTATLKGLYADGRVPVCRVGRSIRFLRSDLTSYVMANRTPAA